MGGADAGDSHDGRQDERGDGRRDGAGVTDADGLDPQGAVRAFHIRFGVAVPPSPCLPPPATAAMRLRLIREETRELEDALADADLIGVADAVADLLYVTLGTAVACGIDIRPVFAEVHRSNMTKDTLARSGPDGKVVKGAGFEPPDLAPLLRAQGWCPPEAGDAVPATSEAATTTAQGGAGGPAVTDGTGEPGGAGSANSADMAGSQGRVGSGSRSESNGGVRAVGSVGALGSADALGGAGTSSPR